MSSESRGKPTNSRRSIDLDPTTVEVPSGWRSWQSIERRAAQFEPTERVFTGTDGKEVHPHSISQAFERLARAAGVSRDPLP